MNSSSRNTGALKPDELKAVYAISRVVAEQLEIDDALSQIVRLARPVFIFDNAVLYLQDPKSEILEPTFARAIGRGRTSEADLSWGEKAARETFSTGQIHLSKPEPDKDSDRLKQGYYLGQPMLVGGNIIGALVFIRFGGPNFSKEQINLAEFIATHVTQVLERRRLVTRVANLEAQRKLAQLQSDFLATVSHELKTPLGFIKGYSTTLLREDTEWSKSEQKEFLEIIDDEADRMAELVNNLLDSSRLQAGKLAMNFADMDLRLYLEELVDRLKIRFPDLSIKITAKKEEYNLSGDSKRIIQVLENIIENAIKYAPNSPITIWLAENHENISIQIEDFGPGISEEHLEHIFERFYRVPDNDRSIRGSGLGLYICQQIILSHSGEISVRSEIGKGTKFMISLPIKRNMLRAKDQQ